MPSTLPFLGSNECFDRDVMVVQVSRDSKMSEESITAWVTKLRVGDEQAAKHLWERFFSQLVKIARSRLQTSSRTMVDEEDVALSALKSFCIGMRNGKFMELSNREGLWRLLLTITLRKVADKQNYDRRLKRNVARERILPLDEEDFKEQLNAFVSREPGPDTAAECSEEMARLLAVLEHSNLKQIALMKMEGYKNTEIAQQIGCSLSSVERKIRTIRSIWSQS